MLSAETLALQLMSDLGFEHTLCNLQVAAKQKKAAILNTGPLARSTNIQTRPEHTQAGPQPDSPVTQCDSHASIRHSSSSLVPAGVADEGLCQQDGRALPAHNLSDNPADPQTASKPIMAQSVHSKIRRRNNSRADPAGCSLSQAHQPHRTETVKTAAIPRPSSWQRRKAAKLCQAQQLLQQGRSQLLSTCRKCMTTTVCMTCKQQMMYTACACQHSQSKQPLLVNAKQCVSPLFRSA